MASTEEFVKFICEQMENAGTIRYRKMFGEYAVYCNDKVVALICDDKLYVKSTEGGRAFIGGDLVEAPAYQGAKSSYFIEDKFENKEWISELISITEKELPVPKPKKKKVSRT
jgi:TfoX/Sxy family transcriptional regulator of competence genes